MPKTEKMKLRNTEKWLRKTSLVSMQTQKRKKKSEKERKKKVERERERKFGENGNADEFAERMKQQWKDTVPANNSLSTIISNQFGKLQ